LSGLKTRACSWRCSGMHRCAAARGCGAGDVAAAAGRCSRAPGLAPLCFALNHAHRW
jgi:hypothetical protein